MNAEDEECKQRKKEKGSKLQISSFLKKGFVL